MRRRILAAEADWSYKSRWRTVSDFSIDFVKKLLVKDPALRLSAKEALHHDWMFESKPRIGDGEPTLSKETLRSMRGYAEGSRVKRAVLQLLALELAPEETGELRKVFMSLDTDAD